MGNASAVSLNTKRVEALADGVFAIAMTLLVLNITVPSLPKDITNTVLLKALFKQITILGDYAISFILLAIFWIIHQKQFTTIKQVNRRLLWINIFILMFTALIPFSTLLQGKFPTLAVAELFFQTNLFIIGTLLYLHWYYASKNHRLIDTSVSDDYITMSMKRSLVFPCLSLLAMIIALVNPQWCELPYFLIPLVLMRYKK